jgi:hypothetical protein
MALIQLDCSISLDPEPIHMSVNKYNKESIIRVFRRKVCLTSKVFLKNACLFWEHHALRALHYVKTFKKKILHFSYETYCFYQEKKCILKGKMATCT